jgi:hypothetical protein
MASHFRKYVSWQVCRGEDGSVEITCNSDSKLLMTEFVDLGTPILEMLGRAFSKFGVPFQIVTNEPEFALISISEMVASFGVQYRFEVSTG